MLIKSVFALLGFGALLLLSQIVRGQSALDGFDPNVNGPINVIVVQPDGKILIGGGFTTVAPNSGATVTRNHIARLNTDGTVDTGFNPNATGDVLSIALQADGKILVGGAFQGPNSIGGQTRSFIARLDAITGAADSFDPNANGGVYAIAVQADGKILAGGDFNSIGGQTRNGIARLVAATGLADSFDPNANAFAVVLAIAVQPNGKILVGGDFSSIGGQTRIRMARLDPVTGLADSFNPNANAPVFAIAVQADGKILAGGDFNGANSIGGATRNNIARLDATTGLADSFNPNADFRVASIVVQPDGRILVAGNFTSVGGQSRSHIARLDPTTGATDSFDPNASGSINVVFAVAVQSDGKILVGGGFTMLSPNGGAAVTRNNITRLESDGRLDRTLNLSLVGTEVYAVAVQPDGKILIGGIFTSVLGMTRNHIARLNTDGTLDLGFNPNTTGSTPRINTIAVQTDGKILVAGAFTGIGGQARKSIARLDAITGAADSFDPNPVGPAIIPTVYSIALQADGKILAGGVFDNIGGQTRANIARLDATTGLADSFNPSADGNVFAIAVQSDGKILAAGSFSSIGGQPRNCIGRLDATTGAADSFQPNASNQVLSIAVQADGKILAGGAFINIGGQARNRIARLDAVTGLADSFDPNADGAVYSIAIQADGRILIAGEFTKIGVFNARAIARLNGTSGTRDALFNANAGTDVHAIGLQADGKILAGGPFTGLGGGVRNHFARLTNDTTATQNLGATASIVTWTRSGCSPEFTRVTFEQSTDNVNYSILGNGTAAGNNWSLTGLNLPTRQNIYIRARGYYHSGYFTASESNVESVRNVFLPPVLKILSITRANGHVLLQCLGAPNQVNNLQVSPDLSAGTFMTIVPPPPAADPTGAFSYDDATGLTKRFYRLTYP